MINTEAHLLIINTADSAIVIKTNNNQSYILGITEKQELQETDYPVAITYEGYDHPSLIIKKAGCDTVSGDITGGGTLNPLH